ncbi:lytic transglycosylase [Falsochrobactrum shanghaiense]|uniref:Lytic transglycosylase n=2 Tax=Falsochrobactrum shanghaiense TaxID=2201899 RepID=A0A316J7L6_9HYPH|nr:lytic transglycosylase domain-containing protein [Falsochrobactrum shanghaiense]PWL17311.1 lytic transglycosylase [Falsochrobactrum shanghaiense]
MPVNALLLRLASVKPLLVLLAAIAALSSDPQAARAENICEREMHRASIRHDVPLGILYAVGLTETGRKNSLQPYAMNIEGRAEFLSSPVEALRRFTEVRAEGARLIDLGCMQINYYYHNQEFSSVAAMLTPSLNVDYAARFLRRLREREGNWTMAVARYHAGPNNDPAQKRYVCRVMTNMVATGFGNWTPQARSFCFG